MRIHYTIRFFLRCVYYLVSCFHLSRSSSRMSEIKKRQNAPQQPILDGFFFSAFLLYFSLVCLFIPAQRILVCRCWDSIFVYVFFGGPSSGAMHTRLCSMHSSDFIFLMSSGSLTSNTAHIHTHTPSDCLSFGIYFCFYLFLFICFAVHKFLHFLGIVEAIYSSFFSLNH